jgi:hypothetical protein
MYKTSYEKIVAAIRNYNKAEVKDTFMKNAKSRYVLKKNVRSDNLICKVVKKVKEDGITHVEYFERKVLWYKRLFDIVHPTHLNFLILLMPVLIRLQLMMYGGFTRECGASLHKPLPRLCSKHQALVAEQMNPLRMIISKTTGYRAQMDLVDFRRKPDKGYRWNICYVDHHSGFAHVACLKERHLC